MMRRFFRLMAIGSACMALPLACNSSSTKNPGGDTAVTGAETTTTAGTTSGGTSTGGNGNQTVAPNIPVLPAKCATTTTADATITVTTAKGPLGGAPQAVNNKLYSMNIDDKNPGDYNQTLNPTFVAYLKGLRPALLRWPSGYYGQTYQFSPTGGQVNGFTGLTPDTIDKFMALCKAVGAAPLMAVNIAGTTDNAQQFVTYVNKTKGYNVTWWQLGNEPDVEGWTATKNPNQYAATYLRFVSAMSATDSSIKFAGVEIMTGADIMGTYGSGNPDWATPIMAASASRPVDALCWHYYPMDSSQTNLASSATPSPAHLLQESASDWPPAGLNFASIVMPKIRSLQASYAPKSEVWIDEFAEDSGKLNGGTTGDRVAGALWAADAIGRYAEQGVSAMFKFIFKGGPEHFYTMLDSNNVPRAEYYSYWLYAQHWGDRVVTSTSDQIASVAAHSAIRAADGTLRVMLVNKTTSAKNVRLTLPDFKPTASAQFVMTGTSLTDTSVTLNGTTLSPTSVAQGEQAIAMTPTTNACSDNVINVPPLSAMMLLFAP
jgi:hypothetical protein